MIFAFSTDDRGLMAFPSETEAVAYCEGVDVEDGVWLFWNDRGDPLVAHFSVPNTHAGFVVVSGKYSLVEAASSNLPVLVDLLGKVRSFESPAPFNSAEGVRVYLESQRA